MYAEEIQPFAYYIMPSSFIYLYFPTILSHPSMQKSLPPSRLFCFAFAPLKNTVDFLWETWYRIVYTIKPYIRSC